MNRAYPMEFSQDWGPEMDMDLFFYTLDQHLKVYSDKNKYSAGHVSNDAMGFGVTVVHLQRVAKRLMRMNPCWTIDVEFQHKAPEVDDLRDIELKKQSDCYARLCISEQVPGIHHVRIITKRKRNTDDRCNFTVHQFYSAFFCDQVLDELPYTEAARTVRNMGPVARKEKKKNKQVNLPEQKAAKLRIHRCTTNLRLYKHLGSL